MNDAERELQIKAIIFDVLKVFFDEPNAVNPYEVQKIAPDLNTNKEQLNPNLNTNKEQIKPKIEKSLKEYNPTDPNEFRYAGQGNGTEHTK